MAEEHAQLITMHTTTDKTSLEIVSRKVKTVEETYRYQMATIINYLTPPQTPETEALKSRQNATKPKDSKD